MDKDSISNIPVSELTKEQLDSLRGSSSAKDTRGSHNRLPLIIAGVVLLIGVGVAMYFIFRPKDTTPPVEDDTEEAGAEVVWEAPADSADPANDYVQYKQATIDNADATDAEKLDAKLSIANLYSATERYEEAQILLDGIERESLTPRMRFNLYNSYVYLYERNGDESAYEEYSKLVEDTLNEPWSEEEPEIEEDIEEQ